MRWITKSDLTELTGKAWVTIAKRLNQHRVKTDQGQYPSDVALAVIYAGDYDTGDGEVLQPQAEKARLDRLRANKVELDLQIMRGELLKLDEAKHAWAQVGVNIKQKMLALPTKAAPLLIGVTTLPQVKEILDNLISEALDELSSTPPGIGTDAGNLSGDEAAAEMDGEPVGGQEPEAKPRKRGRTRTVAD